MFKIFGKSIISKDQKIKKINFEWKKIFKYNTKDIAYIAMLLCILIIAKFIEFAIPSLPNGLGNIAKFNEIIILLGAFLFGFRITFTANLIYLIVFCISLPTFFASGIFINGAHGDNPFYTVAGIYFLDYFIPLSIISTLGLFYKKNLNIKIIATICLLFISFLSHITSGYIFFASFSGDFLNGDLGVNLYIWLANLISYSLFYSISIPLVILSHKIQPFFEKIKNKNSY